VSERKHPRASDELYDEALLQCMNALCQVGGTEDDGLVWAAHPAFTFALSVLEDRTPEERARSVQWAREALDELSEFYKEHANDPVALANIGVRFDADELEGLHSREQERRERQQLALWNAMSGRPLAVDQVGKP